MRAEGSKSVEKGREGGRKGVGLERKESGELGGRPWCRHLSKSRTLLACRTRSWYICTRVSYRFFLLSAISGSGAPTRNGHGQSQTLPIHVYTEERTDIIFTLLIKTARCY